MFWGAQTYSDMFRFGPLIATIDAMGIRDNTYIIFSSVRGLCCSRFAPHRALARVCRCGEDTCHGMLCHGMLCPLFVCDAQLCRCCGHMKSSQCPHDASRTMAPRASAGQAERAARAPTATPRAPSPTPLAPRAHFGDARRRSTTAGMSHVMSTPHPPRSTRHADGFSKVCVCVWGGVSLVSWQPGRC